MRQELHCPFPVRANPNTGEAERFLRTALRDVAADTWLSSFDIGKLAGLAYPDVSAERLRVATAWFAFFWLFEEAWADRMPLDAAGDLGRVHGRVSDILGGQRTSATDHPSLRMLSTLLELVPGDWDASAFHRELLRYLQATLWEVDLRARAAVPPLSAYLRMRPLIAAVPPSRELDFLICDLTLDATLKMHPLVELADTAAGNYSCWVNDIYSLGTERGSPANLVTVAQHEFGWPEPRAVAWAASAATAELATFQRVCKQLAGVVPAELAGELERYLAHYEGWFVASAQWMPTTGKYHDWQ
jgi:hypothetical protein